MISNIELQYGQQCQSGVRKLTQNAKIKVTLKIQKSGLELQCNKKEQEH